MKPKLNKYNYKKLDEMKRLLETRYPGMAVGFYLKNFTKSSMATSAVASSATFEVHGPDLIWRIYRRSDTPDENVWDVDQINSINKRIKLIPKKKDIIGHHISRSIEEDIMRRNQLLFEVIEDENGDFILNANADGLVQSFINFEDKPNRES